jgi:hypothetical protein
MADFARILAAIDQVLGTEGFARFAEQARTMAEDFLSADPFLAAMAETEVDFTGTSAELLVKVSPDEDGWRRPRDWPKNARSVTSLLKRNAPACGRPGGSWSTAPTYTPVSLSGPLLILRRPVIHPSIPSNPSKTRGKQGKQGTKTDNLRSAGVHSVGKPSGLVNHRLSRPTRTAVSAARACRSPSRGNEVSARSATG